MINIKGWGALSFYTCDWRSQYCGGRLKSVFIVARNVQHIILKSKSTKAPLMSVLYNHRNHGVSSNLSQKFTILWGIQKDGGRFHFIHIIDVEDTMRCAYCKMIYTCIYNCKEGPVHHIEVKKYKSAPHISPLQSYK